ncbi:MAG: T9SS type A sorting domain-containing protein [Bacteroidota bacterium]|nr:T9SS type A sorting domain-containing protein [Bacteroidota bacterium]
MKKILLILTCIMVCLLFHTILIAQPCQPALPQSYVNTTYSLPTGNKIIVNAGGNLQTALNNAQPGDVVELQAGATFTGNFTLRKKTGTGWIYIRTSKESSLPAPGTRISPADAPNMAKILSAGMVSAFLTESGASHYRLIGLEIGMPTSATDQFTLVSFGSGSETKLADLPNNLIIDRCYIHGNNTGNLKVGLALNCAHAAIIDSRIDNIHAESGVSTFESKTISCFNGAGPFKIVNNYLEASHINILFGGALSAIPNLVPSDVEIRCNLMTKRVSWNPADPSFAGKIWGVKNVFEIKSGQRMLLEGNILEHSWPSDPNVAGGPQFGCAILLSTRDENRTMPWCVVQDITIRNNIIRHTNCGVSLYGSEGKGEHRIKFYNNLFEDIGGSWGPNDKTGRLFQITAINDLCIDHNTLLHSANNILFAYGTASTIILTNNITQWFDGFQGTSFTGWEKNVFIGGKPAGFSSSNYFPTSISNVNFVNYAGGDYRLATNSPYKNAGTDGKDIGCDITALNTIITACSKVTTATLYLETNERILKICPNPNKGTFTLYMPGLATKTISVFDVMGRPVNVIVTKYQQTANLDMNPVIKGLYLLRISGEDNQLLVRKFLVD